MAPQRRIIVATANLRGEIIRKNYGGSFKLPRRRSEMILELKTTLTGKVSGRETPNQPYRARLVQEKDEHVILQVGQPFADGTIGWLSGWRLTTLLKSPADILHLNWGQDWYVEGMGAVLNEAFEHVILKLKEE
jgi:hypothetical protein